MGGGFKGVVRLTVPVSSHHIPEAGPGTDVSQNLFDNIIIIGNGTAFIGVGIRAEVIFLGPSVSAVRFSSQW